jgi:hypothetical protein
MAATAVAPLAALYTVMIIVLDIPAEAVNLFD